MDKRAEKVAFLEIMRDMRASLEPQARKQLSETREQIRAVLTPEQREQFERLVKQRPGRRNDGSGQPERERRLRDQRNPPPPGGQTKLRTAGCLPAFHKLSWVR